MPGLKWPGKVLHRVLLENGFSSESQRQPQGQIYKVAAEVRTMQTSCGPAIELRRSHEQNGAPGHHLSAKMLLFLLAGSRQVE